MLSSQEANCENCRIKSRQDNILQGKSFLVAVFLCVRAILYPGSKLVIASGTRGQSINVLEKIRDDLMPKSPYLRNEIAKFQISNAEAYIKFHNDSIIKVVTASDTSRSNRANILIISLSSYAEMHSRNRAKSKEAKWLQGSYMLISR